jgi:hypothetical protein
MERRHWRDAEEARGWLQERPMCRTVLYLLSRLPFLDIRVLLQLAGQHGPASMYRSVARLRNAGLIASIQPPVYTPNSPHLFYLTDLGVATIALDLGCDPRQLAQRFGLRAADLLKLAPVLRHLLDTYDLLGALAASHLGKPALRAWERPWRRRYTRPGGKTGGSVTLPAYAALSWGGVTGSYLLLPDPGTIPLRLQRRTLEHLVLLRRSQNGRLPFLLIATTDRNRTTAWERLFHEAERLQREAPLTARIVRWDDLPGGLSHLPIQENNPPEATVTRSIRLLPLHIRHASSTLPPIVGTALRAPALSTTVDPDTVALVVTPSDYRVLEVVGFHPFLTANQMSDVLGDSTASVRRRLNRLLALGLIRSPSVDEVSEQTLLAMSELTKDGLKLVAARLGLSLTVAAREFGLVGGGPNEPTGSRSKLVRTLAHTQGTDEIFVGMYRQARKRSAAGHDEEIVEWQNAAACSRRHLRPDGYGVYRRGTHYDGFFLEYDRGTMNARDYFRKFGAYYRYEVTRRFEQDYNSYPTILVVTADNAGEERIARVARAVAVGQPDRLPLLLTCRWRIDDVGNSRELLGPIWREPFAAWDDRCIWPTERIVVHRDRA